MAPPLLETIKSRGYWSVLLRPTVFDEHRVGTLAALERAFDTSHIELRGWDYPHRPKEGPTRHADHIQGTVDWEHHKELWRLYQSGQFVHLFAMNEDWWFESGWMKGHPPGMVKPGELLEVGGALFTLTEVFLFAARLVEALNIGPDLTLRWNLHQLANRRLQTLDPRRLPLHDWRKAAPDLHEFGHELALPAHKLIAASAELAIDETLRLYERFHWEPARQALVDDQRKLLERRL